MGQRLSFRRVVEPASEPIGDLQNGFLQRFAVQLYRNTMGILALTQGVFSVGNVHRPCGRVNDSAQRCRARDLKRQGWRQQEMADALGVRKGAVSKWMKLGLKAVSRI